MSDLIDRQAAIKAVLGLENCYNGFSDTYDKACIIGVIEGIPAADAVEVVRCKDCRHYLTGMFCEAWADLHPHAETYPEIPSRGYCHLAERRTDA